jgi:hypothetical protein
VSHLADAQVEQALENEGYQSGFTVIAPPAATPSGPAWRAALLPLAAGIILGLGLAIGLVAAVTWTDSAVHSPEDVFDRLGLATVAVVHHGYRPVYTMPSPPLHSNGSRPLTGSRRFGLRLPRRSRRGAGPRANGS